MALRSLLLVKVAATVVFSTAIVTSWGCRVAERIKLKARFFAFLFLMFSIAEASASNALSEETFYFDIPRQQADGALTALGQQADITVLYRYDTVRGYQTNQLKGEYRLDEAISFLLANTGLKAEFASVGHLIITDETTTRGDKVKPKISKPNAITGVFAAIASLFGGAGQVAAQATDTSTAQPEEIVVTGIRGSLVNAIAVKKKATSILDVISSEDIGKLPDENVAETLQRINGVQITRRNGEGAGVAVRGLEQNRLEVDGVTLVNPTGRNSGPNEGTFPVLQFVPSDLLSGVQVAKSASADQIAGSLGGTVNLTLLKPLDIGDKVSVSVQAAYDDRVEDVDPRFSVAWSKTFADDTLGVLLSYSQSERSVGEELFFSRTGWAGIDTNGDGVQDSNFAPGDFRAQTLEEDRERKGFLGNIQWRPADSTEVYLTGLFASFDLERDRNWFSSADSGGSDLNNYVNPVVSAAGTIVSGEFVSQIQGNGENLTNDSKTYSVILGANHSVNNWTFSGKATTGKATQDNLQNFARIRQNGVSFSRDFSDSLPTLNVLGGFDVLDPQSYNLSSGLIGFANDNRFESEESTFQFDVDYELEGSFFTSVETGLRWATQESSVVSFRAGADDGNGVWLVPIENGLVDGTDALFETVSLSDVYGGALSGEASFLAANPVGLGGLDELLAFVNDNSPGGSRSNQGIFRSLASDNAIEEDIFAVYLKANFEAELGDIPVSGNIGIRYVETDQDSTFNLLTANGAVPSGFSRTYDDVLPSLNLRFDLREDVVLRFAASQVLTRPATSSLSGGLIIDDPAGTASGGNPALDPAMADAYDLSLEWYINDANSLTGALFHKDIEGFLESVTEFRAVPGAVNANAGDPANLGTNNFLVTSVAATETSSLTGFELAYQTVWDNGFGVQANYTYVDSDGVAGLPLSGLSESSYNVVGFFEVDDYSVRLAYNWRDEYLVSPSFNGVPLFQQDRGQLDFSASYNVTDNTAVTFEAINLNDERVDEFATLAERQFRIANTGRRFFLGVRSSF